MKKKYKVHKNGKGMLLNIPAETFLKPGEYVYIKRRNDGSILIIPENNFREDTINKAYGQCEEV